MASKSRKVLVPLATLLAAGAVAVGSGATFTSSSGNTISAFTAGTLEQTNSKDGKAIFDLDNLKPGDTLNGTLTLTNSGSLDAAFSLVESKSVNGFTGQNLQLRIVNTTDATDVVVYSGTFGDLVDGAATDLGTFEAGETNEYLFSVTLAAGAGNADQGKTASAVYTWNSVQLDAETFEQ